MTLIRVLATAAAIALPAAGANADDLSAFATLQHASTVSAMPDSELRAVRGASFIAIENPGDLDPYNYHAAVWDAFEALSLEAPGIWYVDGSGNFLLTPVDGILIRVTPLLV